MYKIKNFLLTHKYPIALIIIPFVVFWRNLLPIPGQVFLGNDSILSFNTLASLIFQLRQGILPLWDPHTFFGIPLLTRPDSMVFYPPFGLFVLFGTLVKISNQTIFYLMELLTVFHYSLAGIGTYLFLKKLNLSKFSAFIGGLIYMLNGGLIAFATTTALQVSMSLLPYVLLTFDSLVRKPSLRRLSIFSLVFALPVITFSWTSAITYHSIFLFYYFWYLFFTREIKSFWKAGFFAFFGLVLAAFVSAVVVLPGLEVPVISNRANLNFAQSAFGGNLQPRQIFDFFIPYLTATNYSETEVLHVYNGTVPYTYVGLLTWLFIIPSFYKKRHALQLFFFFASIIILLFSFGGDSPVFSLFYVLFFPLMRVFSEHRLVLYLAQFCLAVTAAFGLENVYLYYKDNHQQIVRYRGWLLNFFKLLLLTAVIIFLRVDQVFWTLREPQEPPTPYFQGLSNLVLFLIVFGTSVSCFFLLDTKKRAYKLIIFLVLFFDLFMFAEKYPINQLGVNPTYLLSNNEVVQYLTQDNSHSYYRSDIRAIPHNYASSLFNINHIIGYLVYTNKITVSFYELMSFNPRNRLVDTVAALRYVVTETDINTVGYKLVFEHTVSISDRQYYHIGVGGWELVPAGTKIRVYENMAYFPFPILVNNVVSVDDSTAKDLMVNQKYNPKESAIVGIEDSNFVDDLKKDTAQGTNTVTEPLTLVDKNTEKVYSTNAVDERLLVTTLPYYPDWKVQVDGVQAEVIRTNLAFMGVVVPSGRHEIRFYYQPNAFILGFIISVVSLLFSLLLAIFGGNQERFRIKSQVLDKG